MLKSKAQHLLFPPPSNINVPFCFSYINYIIFAAFGRGQKLPNSSIGIIIKPMMKITLAGTWTIIACNIIKAIKALNEGTPNRMG